MEKLVEFTPKGHLVTRIRHVRIDGMDRFTLDFNTKDWYASSRTLGPDGRVTMTFGDESADDGALENVHFLGRGSDEVPFAQTDKDSIEIVFLRRQRLTDTPVTWLYNVYDTGTGMQRFELEGKGYVELVDAAQDAECKHAADNQPHRVVALVDCEHGMFKKGEVVYISKGAPE